MTRKRDHNNSISQLLYVGDVLISLLYPMGKMPDLMKI